MERVSLEEAWVLHGRAYRESSEILELFTRNHGRVSVVARGMRSGRPAMRALLQPFRPLAVSWSGRGGGLMGLRGVEPAAAAISLRGTALMSAYYATELLLRFLHKGDPHPDLFTGYAATLEGLAAGATTEGVLRRFEVLLLAESGYGLNLDHDAASGEPIEPGRRYRYVVERGAVAEGDEAVADALSFTGEELLDVARGEFRGAAGLAAARRLLRAVLDHHLSGQPLRTRQVFAAMKRQA